MANSITIIQSIFISLVAGTVASLVAYFLLVGRWKPNVIVADEICKDPNSEHAYRVKAVNRTQAILTNVHYYLFYHTILPDGNSSVTEISPFMIPLPMLDSFSKHNTDYAVRIRYEIDENKFPLNENTKIVFTVFAEHSVSNSVKCAHKEYTSKDIIKGVYESGISTKIICV